MKKQSRTVPRRRQSVSPTPRHLPLVDILIDTQAELQELVVASGLKVLEAMLEEDRAAVCGPRYAHQPARQAYRTGHTPSQVVLGGRKVAIRRPRARRAGEEVPLPTARAFANADPLNRRMVDQMLIGVATRQYARSLEPLGADVTTRGTSKSAVSRRFVAQTQAQLDAWRATPLDALDLVGLLIDGVHVGGHCIVVALGIDKMGAKHPLGLWEGATENATVCQGLLTNLGSRGLRTDRSLLVIVDGAKALDTAVTQTFGRAALVQRCQVHKGRNILEHLPEAQRPWVKAVLTRAYTNSHVKTAKRLLQDLARRLDTDYPSGCLRRSLLVCDAKTLRCNSLWLKWRVCPELWRKPFFCKGIRHITNSEWRKHPSARVAVERLQPERHGLGVSDGRGPEDNLLRLEPLAVKTFVGVAILTDGVAVDGDAGKQAARAGVAENLRPQLQIGGRLGLAPQGSRRHGRVRAQLELIGDEVLEAAPVPDDQDQIDRLPTDLQAKATARDGQERRRGPAAFGPGTEDAAASHPAENKARTQRAGKHGDPLRIAEQRPRNRVVFRRHDLAEDDRRLAQSPGFIRLIRLLPERRRRKAGQNRQSENRCNQTRHVLNSQLIQRRAQVKGKDQSLTFNLV